MVGCRMRTQGGGRWRREAEIAEDNARANSRRDGIGKTTGFSRRLRARKSDLNLIRVSPCRPTANINALHRTVRTRESPASQPPD